MTFSSRKFLELLNANSQSSNPAGDFAKFMAARSLGVNNVSMEAIVKQTKKDADKKANREQGVLSKAFEVLLAPMNAVESSIMDVTDSDQSLGEKVANVGNNIGAAYLNVQNPILEALTPTFNHPFEEDIEKYVDKHSNQYHGDGPISGSRLLEERLGWEDGTAGRGTTGFGVDIALDPLTYLSGGILPVAKTLLKGGKAAKEGLKLAEEGAEAATKSNPAVAKAMQDLPLKAKDKSTMAPIQKINFNDGGKSYSQTLKPILKQEGPLYTVRDVSKLPVFNEGSLKGMSKIKAKSNPTSVTMKWGDKLKVNPHVVRETIDAINDPLRPTAKLNIPEATGELAELAVVTAEKFTKNLGKGGRHAQLTPANQANLMNRLDAELRKRIEAVEGPGAASAPQNQRRILTEGAEMLKTAESYLRKNKGLQGMAWDGSGLALSKVIEHVGPENLTDDFIPRVLNAFKTGKLDEIVNPDIKRAVESAIAERATKTGAVAEIVLDGHANMSKKIMDEWSPQKYHQWKKSAAVKDATFKAAVQGLASKEVDRVVDMVRNYVNVDGIEHLEPYQILDNLSTDSIQKIVDGKIDTKLIERMNKAFMATTGKTPEWLAKDITGYGVLDEHLQRINAWTGRYLSTWSGRHVESKHFAASGYGALEAAAKMRANWFADKLANYSKQEQEEAWYLAQGALKSFEKVEEIMGGAGKAGTERTRVLANQILDYMDNITGSKSTMKSVTDLGGTPIVRSQMTMLDIDRQLGQLGSNFRFKDWVSKKKNIRNEPRNYTDTSNWMHAWENVDPKKLGQTPLQFMYDLDLAVERVMTEYAVIDSFAGRFGRRPGQAGYDPLVHRTSLAGHNRIAGDLRFDTESARQFNRLMQDMETGPWMPKGKVGREFVRATGKWKRGVTIYNPAHHIRNLTGDSWLMWMAGINDPRVFKWSKQLIHAERGKYKEVLNDPTLDALRGLINKEEFALSKTTGETVILKRNGADLTAKEIYGEAMQRGLLASADRIEDIVGATNYISGGPEGLRKGLDAAHNAASKTSEYREHYVRLAHFTGAINKQLTRQVAAKLKNTASLGERRAIMEEVYEKATREVRKWHPDGRDLSQFEQKYMRNLIPFYSWQRKSIPLILEGLTKRPAKVTMYPKATFALQQELGIESPGPADTFPTDQLYPNFMRAGGIGPIGDPESDNPVAKFFGSLGRNAINPYTGAEEGRTVINPGNPFNDVISDLGMGSRENASTMGWGMLHPALSLPMQALSNETPTGQPISEDANGEGFTPWALGATPIVSMGQRVLELGEEKAEGTEPGFDMQSFLNMLTGAGIQGSGQYRKSAEFDAKEFAKKLAEK